MRLHFRRRGAENQRPVSLLPGGPPYPRYLHLTLAELHRVRSEWEARRAKSVAVWKVSA